MSAMLLTNLTLESEPGLRDFFLGRLASMVARQLATMNPGERTMLGEAIFSVYLDCLDLGLGQEAQAIVDQLRHGTGQDEALAA
jgi:hypothetical protein